MTPEDARRLVNDPDPAARTAARALVDSRDFVPVSDRATQPGDEEWVDVVPSTDVVKYGPTVHLSDEMLAGRGLDEDRDAFLRWLKNGAEPLAPRPWWRRLLSWRPW